MRALFTNNASGVLADGIGDTDTSLNLSPGYGARFAPMTDGWQMLTIEDAADPGVVEIVKAIDRMADMVTIERAQEGTTALAWAAGTQVSARITAGMLDSFIQGRDAGNVAIGDAASTSPYPDAGAVAIGSDAKAMDYGSVAIGRGAESVNNGSVAIGENARADTGSQAIGKNARTYASGTWSMAGLPALTRQNYPGNDETPLQNCGAEGAGATAFVDLGVVPVWQAVHAYYDGDVVSPTTPDGHQYQALYENFGDSGADSPGTEPAFEPGDVAGRAGQIWRSADITAGITISLPEGMVFYPSEVGFICFRHGGGVSAAPFVSIGSQANQTLFVSNQQLTQITGARQQHRFADLAPNGVTNSLHFKMVTPAVGGTFMGRFYFKGLLVQAQGPWSEW